LLLQVLQVIRLLQVLQVHSQSACPLPERNDAPPHVSLAFLATAASLAVSACLSPTLPDPRARGATRDCWVIPLILCPRWLSSRASCENKFVAGVAGVSESADSWNSKDARPFSARRLRGDCTLGV
jgi:hypothetical protein